MKMKKISVLILAVSMLFFTVSCGRAASPEVLSAEPEPVGVETAEPAVTETTVEAARDNEQQMENISICDAPAPASAATEIPAASPAAMPSHSHNWVEISETVQHAAITEERKVIDQAAVEGHFEGGSYSVVVCRCGTEFCTADAFLSHQRSAEDIEQHGGYTTSVRSDQVWIEGTPEAFHYETVTVQEAWGEEVITGYICETCGASK